MHMLVRTRRAPAPGSEEQKVHGGMAAMDSVPACATTEELDSFCEEPPSVAAPSRLPSSPLPAADQVDAAEFSGDKAVVTDDARRPSTVSFLSRHVSSVLAAARLTSQPASQSSASGRDVPLTGAAVPAKGDPSGDTSSYGQLPEATAVPERAERKPVMVPNTRGQHVHSRFAAEALRARGVEPSSGSAVLDTSTLAYGASGPQAGQMPEWANSQGLAEVLAERDLWKERALLAERNSEILREAVDKAQRERSSWEQVADALQVTNSTLAELVRKASHVTDDMTPEDDLAHKYVEATMRLADQDHKIAELQLAQAAAKGDSRSQRDVESGTSLFASKMPAWLAAPLQVVR